jgi:hypothetical protein
MARYAITNGGLTTAVSDTTAVLGCVLAVQSTAAGRCYMYDLMWGCYGDTPADAALNYQLNRITDGTATTIVAEPMDLADAAAGGRGLIETTTGLTVTADTDLLSIGANQRSTQRWVAAPGGELIVPNTDKAGILFSAVTASGNIKVQSTIHFWE